MDTYRHLAKAALISVASLVVGRDSHAAATDFGVVDGTAMVRAPGGADFEQVATGAHVTVGNAVRAPDDASVTVTLNDGVTVTFGPGAAASLSGLTYLPAEHPGAKPARAYQFALTAGELHVTVPVDAAKPHGLIVLLPGGASFSSWRGSANVAIHGDKANAVVYDGVAIAGGGGQWRPIHVGGSAVFSGNTPAVLRSTIPAAPTWAATPTPGFAIVRAGERARLPMAWTAIEGAAVYRLEVARDAEMLHLVARSEVEGLSSVTGPLPAGHYFARIRAVSADGVVGAASTPKGLRVAEVSPPAAAFVAADGALVMPGTSAVTVGDPTGIEVAYQRASRVAYEPMWNPASNEIRMGNDPVRVVRFRDAVTHDEAEARFTLVRRDLRASVEMTPRGARWPEQPVSITVRAFDPSGRLDAANEPLSIEVMVNLDPMPVEWTHRGNVWTGRLRPVRGGGPWAVRVGVRDGASTVIGAGLLEVVGHGDSMPAPRVADRVELHVSH